MISRFVRDFIFISKAIKETKKNFEIYLLIIIGDILLLYLFIFKNNSDILTRFYVAPFINILGINLTTFLGFVLVFICNFLFFLFLWTETVLGIRVLDAKEFKFKSVTKIMYEKAITTSILLGMALGFEVIVNSLIKVFFKV